MRRYLRNTDEKRNFANETSRQIKYSHEPLTLWFTCQSGRVGKVERYMIAVYIIYVELSVT